MEIRVVVPDDTGVAHLLDVLARGLGARSVSFDSGCNEIRILAKRDSNRLVVQVLAAVQTWLADECIVWARLRLGFRSYTLVGSTPVASGE
jgi:hypothetical protein